MALSCGRSEMALVCFCGFSNVLLDLSGGGLGLFWEN
jgi:hypothetical protein